MKKLLLITFLLVASIASMSAQSYISYARAEEEDVIADLNGAGGVLVLSKRGDLVFAVDNASHPVITPKGKRDDGLYAYEIVVAKEDNPTPKIEVSKRGDVDRVSFAITTRKDFFLAFMVGEVAKPIRFEDHKQANDIIANDKMAAVEITSAISDLVVDCPKELEAKITTKTKDAGVKETEIVIPLANYHRYRDAVERLSKEVESMTDEVEKAASEGKLNDAQLQARFVEIDKKEAEKVEAEKKLEAVSKIAVYAEGTNRLYIDVSQLTPRQKLVYGVLLRTVVVKEHVSECSGFLEEGGRLFGLRQYKGAREAFVKALSAKDAPANMKSSIKTNITQCDSCITYDLAVRVALKKMKEMKDKGTGNQADVVKYASVAANFMRQLDKYNPSEYYSSKAKVLEKMVEDMPLDIKFTTTKWVNNASGFYEDGYLGNVEVWAYHGATMPNVRDFSSDRKLLKAIGNSPSLYKKMGETDANGELTIHLSRKDLPRGILLRPVGYGDKVKAKYVDMIDVMSQSEGEYNKRQFRTKMYYSDKK